MKTKTICFFVFVLFSITIKIEAQQRPVIKVQSRYNGYVSEIVFSPNGKYFATKNDNTIEIWDFATVKNLKSFNGHTSAIFDIKFSPDGKYLVSCSNDKTIKIWDFSSGKELKTFRGHTEAAWSVAFAPNGKYIVSGSYDKTTKIWDVTTGTLLKTLTGNTEEVKSVACSPDSKYILIGASKTAILWEVSSGKEVYRHSMYNNCTSVAISPNGMFSAILSDEEITLRDLLTGKVIASNQYSHPLQTINFTPDSKYIVASSSDATIEILDVSSPNLGSVKSISNLPTDMDDLDISPDGKYLITDGNYNSMCLFDFTTGKQIWNMFFQSGEITMIRYSPEGKSALSLTSDNKLAYWDVISREKKSFRVAESEKISTAGFSLSGKYYATCSDKDTAVELHDAINGKLIWKKTIKTAEDSRCSFDMLSFSHNDKILAIGLTVGYQKTVKLLKIESGDEIWSKKLGTKDGYLYIKSMVFTPEDKAMYLGIEDMNNSPTNCIKLWDISTGNPIKSIPFVVKEYDYASAICLSPDAKYAAWAAKKEKSVTIINLQTGLPILKVPKLLDGINSLDISPNNKYILVGSGERISDNRQDALKLLDLNTGKELKNFNIEGSGNIITASFSPDGKYILSGSGSNIIKLWETETGNCLYTNIYSPDGTQSITYTNDGYWDATSNGGELVAMVMPPFEGSMDYNVWNIDQFAVKTNRPDIILQKLGTNDIDLSSHFYSLFKKRLRKLGLTEEQLTDEFHVPTSRIVETIINDKLIDLKFKLSDDKYNLKRYNIYINDIPLLGSLGKETTGNNADLTETITLIEGDNKIEVSCINEKGIESYRALTYANYNGTVKRDLYFLAFGVSKYQNSAYNLQFADKDALDLSKVIESSKGKGFENVYTKILTNEQVTPATIKAAKDFVKEAKPDDTFILFIAGHGMHDKDAEATYYYLTSNADVNNLKGTAADFETIEDLLQGIPPRNKLFLMDACESGEIDEEDQGQMLAAATGSGMASRGFKTTGVIASVATQSAPKRTYLFQKDRYIYNDLVRRSGAIVFSSSKGGELSYERSDIENGLFTEYIMKALTTTEADKDGNGVVSTDELRIYVSEQVAKASGDLQHPTVDRDNIYQKFGFGLH